jgi:hypothetical protein
MLLAWRRRLVENIWALPDQARQALLGGFKQMRLRHPPLIFNVLPRRDPVMIPGTASAQSSNEVRVTESSAEDAVCLYDYEISNEPLAGGLIAVAQGVDYNPGIGVGDVGGLV